MRLGKELIGKPIYSMTDGRELGTVRDLYVDLEVGILNGIFLGNEGVIKRRARAIARENVVILGIDAVLVKDSDVVTDDVQTPEIDVWLRRETIQGRQVETTGGTRVGTVGDILLDESANVVGFALGRVYVEGPVAESKTIMKHAVSHTGGKEGVVTIDFSLAEKGQPEPEEPATSPADESDTGSMDNPPTETNEEE